MAFKPFEKKAPTKGGKKPAKGDKKPADKKLPPWLTKKGK
jgi:hypothetical protein